MAYLVVNIVVLVFVPKLLTNFEFIKASLSPLGPSGPFRVPALWGSSPLGSQPFGVQALLPIPASGTEGSSVLL